MTDLRGWIKDVGFPIVMALLLLSLMIKALPAVEGSVEAMSKTLDRHTAEAFGRGTDIIRLLRAICRHSARTEFQMQDCNE